ncbi:Homeobox protein yox1 [Lecanora helva]
MESNENISPVLTSEKLVNSTSEGQNRGHAFIVHRRDCFNGQVLPDIDKAQIVRQKRRRTSPQDQAVLEAEFERDPKPDKSARLSIVNRVALGEKEVQLCSNTTPSSSASTTASSQQQNASSQDSNGSSQTTAHDFSGNKAVQETNDKPIETPFLAQESAVDVIAEGTVVQDEERRAFQQPEPDVNLVSSSNATEDPSTNAVRSLSQALPGTRHLGYFANRRSASFMIHDEESSRSPAAEEIKQSNSGQDTSKSSQSLKRTSSLVRLSLSLDGKAEVTTRTGTTPSPPRSQPTPSGQAQPRPTTGLQRSYSALEPMSKSSQVPNPIQIPRRRAIGRSRDARTWEFYCDSEARNALIEQAEREERGSATAAISLIRSCSQNKKVMTPNPNKRNAHTQKPDSPKRLKADGQKHGKPKLARATSSIARMQSSTSHTQTQKKSKSGSQIDIFEDPDGDSDKENWEPGTQTRQPPRNRPVHSQRAARFLEESLRVPSQSATSSTEDKENGEVAAFVDETAPREEDELDCVQNLLSLSQAAWQ